MSCILQVNGVPRDGVIGDALMVLMTTPLNNGKFAVAVSDDANIEDPGAVYHAIATRCNPGDPLATPIPSDLFNRVNGKMGIDATVKSRLNEADSDRVWPKDWFEQDIRDYLDDT